VNGIVLFGDVIRSRRDSPGSTSWLRALAAELGAAYSPSERLAPFDFTQGDELQGLLDAGVDPVGAVVRGWLHPARRPMRWVVVSGSVDPGEGPATQRTGDAFLRARDLLSIATTRRDGLLMATGDSDTDRLLDGLAPLLPELLADLTPRQRIIARLILVDGLKRSEAAETLNVSRATISVAADRAHVRAIGRLATSLWTIFAAGQEAAQLNDG
jgi:predicted XRE-type DNA-binding protein